MKNKDGLIMVVCQMCGEHLIVEESKDFLHRINCRGELMPLEDFIKYGVLLNEKEQY
jgi:hypothetical protein